MLNHGNLHLRKSFITCSSTSHHKSLSQSSFRQTCHPLQRPRRQCCSDPPLPSHHDNDYGHDDDHDEKEDMIMMMVMMKVKMALMTNM